MKKLILLILALILTATLILVGGCGDDTEPFTHTGAVVGFVPAYERGIHYQSNWYFICFEDGTEFYIFGKPDIVLGKEVIVYFEPRNLGGLTITKITGVSNEN